MRSPVAQMTSGTYRSRRTVGSRTDAGPPGGRVPFGYRLAGDQLDEHADEQAVMHVLAALLAPLDGARCWRPQGHLQAPRVLGGLPSRSPRGAGVIGWRTSV